MDASQVHNDVSRSKLDRAFEITINEKGKRAEAKRFERSLASVWPGLHQCMTCVTEEGTWKVDAVYEYLLREYWTFGITVDPKIERFMKYDQIEERNISRGLGTYILITLLVLFTFFAQKFRIRATGRHKKEEDLSLRSFPADRKYRVS